MTLQHDLEKIFEPVTAAAASKTDVNTTAFVDLNIEEPHTTTSKTADVLPDLDHLPRPDVLLEQTTPYLVTIFSRGSEIDAQFSHEGTLNLVAKYLERHGRADQNHVHKV